MESDMESGANLPSSLHIKENNVSTGIRTARYRYSPASSNTSVRIDPNEVVYRTSSLALLRAKEGANAGQPCMELCAAKRVVDFMHDLWMRGELCDVTLKTLNGEVRAHRVVLAAWSDMQAKAFLAQPQNQQIIIDVSEYPNDVVIPVIKFLYTTELPITNETLRGTLGVALRLGLDDVIELCLRHLRGFTVDTVLHYQSICQQYGLEEMKAKLSEFICAKFVEVSHSRHFLWLTFEELLKSVSFDTLCLPDEIELFLAIVKWVEFNKQERVQYLPVLLSCVRFDRINPETLVLNVETVSCVMENPSCHQMIYRAMCYHALMGTGSSLAASYASPNSRQPQTDLVKNETGAAISPLPSKQMNKSVVQTHLFHSSDHLQRRHSLPSATDSAFLVSRSQMLSTEAERRASSRPLVVAFGGIDLHSLDSETPGRCVYGYDEQTGRWLSLTNLHNYTHHHGGCGLGGKLYIIGGAVYDSSQPDQLGVATKSVQVYDRDTNLWARLADMYESRAYVGVTAHAGFIYAVGGEDEERRKLDTIERYDPLLDTWTYVARMPGGGRIGAAVATHRGQLYIIGGYNSARSGNPVMADVLCLDLNRGCWVPKTPLIIPRCHASLVEVKGRLYLIGGRTKLDGCQPPISSLSMVEVYDDVNDAWEHVNDLKVPRHDTGCTAIGDYLYIVGGMKTPSPFCLQSIEVLDVETGSWLKEDRTLPHPVTGAACCTLSVPHN